KEWPSPRDNVIFELGLFMGRLGRSRAILMEPREEKVKLPSDLSGITTISYRFEKGGDAAALMAPACNALRDHIIALGPNN
ncbi:MAG: TIR domain-containing protein, partial [Rhodomicrobium sp.]